MDGDFFQSAGRARALLQSAKIERAFHAERAYDLDIGGREMAEMIGAENLAPADDATVTRRIAAEIAKIAGALQIKMAGRDVWHQQEPSVAAEGRASGSCRKRRRASIAAWELFYM